jgi:hypothetical protein
MPVSTRYSRELRDLLGSLLSVPPWLRPSAAAILRAPIVKRHMERLLAGLLV